MSAAAPNISFDDMIQADRKKKKNEALAEKMLGSGRRASAPGAGSLPTRKTFAAAGPGSLASRVGVSKRSASTTPRANIEDKWNHDLHHANNPKVARVAQINRPRSAQSLERSRLAQAVERNLNGKGQFRSNNNGAQMNIRGMAASGPTVVIASNFATGTTAADIRAAMEPVGGEITACYLISEYPTVMAELLFTEKDGAENVVNTFNNQKADGRLLYVYIKPGGPSPRLNNAKSTEAYEETAPAPAPMEEEPVPPPVAPMAPSAPRPAQILAQARNAAPREERDVMDIDDGRPSRENIQRPIPTQPREDRERRREPSYQDGRYGFNETYDRNYPQRDYRRDRDHRDRDRDPRTGLYSDGMYNNRPDNRGYRR